MKILITGGAGFVGARLAATLLARGQLDGRPITRLVLADQAPPRPELQADVRVEARTGPLLDQCAALRDEAFDGVFHLASAVSGECEADFDLGLRSNLDSTRALLDALRHRVQQGGAVPTRLVFSSSIAVFGPDPAYPFPPLWATTPCRCRRPATACRSSFASTWWPTTPARASSTAARRAWSRSPCGRAGPTAAASSFFSGIIREPLAGEDAVLPVDLDVAHPVASPQRMVDGLIAVYEATREAFVGRSAITLPGLNVTVRQMLDALEAVAGPAVRARVKPRRDERIAGIVANWPRGVHTERAHALGLQPDASFEDIIRAYIADNAANPGALKGLA